jgi:phosphate transport system substrate-binding protein
VGRGIDDDARTAGRFLENGAPTAAELDYVPMPASVVKLVQANWKQQLKDGSGKAIY